MECTISKVISKDIRRCIANFSGDCTCPTKVQKTKYLQDSRNNICVEVDSPNTLYKGALFEDKMVSLLIIKRKNSNQAELFKLDHATLKPYVNNVKDTTTTRDERSRATVSELNKLFGTKKAKRHTEQVERMKMDVEHARERLEQTVADVEVEESNLIISNNNEDESLYRPPINRNASTKEQIYVLEKLLPTGILNSLEEQAKIVLDGDLDQFKLKPIIKKILLDIQKSEPPDAIKKCKILLYVDCLLYYLSTPAKNLSKNFKACSYSIEANQHILDNFSSLAGTSGRTRPLSLRDKCICYIMVLLMLASNYTINIEELSQEVKLGMKKVQEIGRILAFSVNGSFLTLKLPLPAPYISSGKRKRK